MNDLAAIYRRVSTDKQDDSLELQENRVLDYCRWKGFRVEPELMFADPDTSGRTPIRERPGGCALMNRLQYGDVKHLVVAKLDRLGRNVRDALNVLEALEKLGITLHITDLGGESISTQGHIGRLILTILMAVAEWEANEIRDRITKSLRAKFDRGELTGHVPYGYDCEYRFADGHTLLSARALTRAQLETMPPVVSRRLVPNEQEARWIRFMTSRRAGGAPLKRIAAELNHLGVSTKQGRPWQVGSVHSVLQSRHARRLIAKA